MDNKKPAEKKNSPRSLKTIVIATGALAVAAAGGAYFFPEYLPLEQPPTPAEAPVVAVKPIPKPASQPAAAPSTASHAALPPAAPATQQPAPATPSAAVPAGPVSAEWANTGLAHGQAPLRKVSATTTKQPKKAKPKQRDKTRRAAKPTQIAKADSNLDERENSQETPPPQDVLLKPAFPQAEPPAEPPPMIPVEPEPAPMPAPVETIPAAETAPAVPPEPDAAPRVTVPKYNDLATAVLRGDREAARELLDLGWWVDKPSASGVTPLMAAVMNRDTAMVKLLLEYGAEPTAQALGLARKNKDAATATLLEQKGAR